MGILDDSAIFAAIIQQAGLSRAAKYLGLSKGLISRRLVQMEKQLGVTLIKRSTRHIQLTPEGEIFFQHALRIQQELDSAVMLLQNNTKKPKGNIRISAPLFFGRHYLTPILLKFLNHFPDINVEIMLTNDHTNLLKENVDLVIRGSGYLNSLPLNNSNLRMKPLLTETISVYASSDYLQHCSPLFNPEQLTQHKIIGFTDFNKKKNTETWEYKNKNTQQKILLTSHIRCNDIESGFQACVEGHGIARLTQLLALKATKKHSLQRLFPEYDWGTYSLYILYPNQTSIPKRTRLLIDFIAAHTKNLLP